MVVNATVVVKGPYSPREFTDISTLSTTMTGDGLGLTGSTLISAEPITVMGNVFIIYTLTP